MYLWKALPCASGNFSDFQVLFVNRNAWVQEVANMFFPHIMLKIQPGQVDKLGETRQIDSDKFII